MYHCVAEHSVYHPGLQTLIERLSGLRVFYYEGQIDTQKLPFVNTLGT